MKNFFYNFISKKNIAPVRQFAMDEHGEKKSLPIPRVLVIEWDGKRAFLYRFLDKETSCGDTWHKTFEDALDQVMIEYPNMLEGSHWFEITKETCSSVKEAVEYIFDSTKENSANGK